MGQNRGEALFGLCIWVNNEQALCLLAFITYLLNKWMSERVKENGEHLVLSACGGRPTSLLPLPTNDRKFREATAMERIS